MSGGGKDDAARASEGERRLRSACRFVGGGRTEVCTVATKDAHGRVLLDGGQRGALSIDRAILDRMLAGGLAERCGQVLALTAQGRSFCAEKPPRGDGLAARPRDIDGGVVAGENGDRIVPVNAAESPLAQLARLKGRDGAPFLASEEWQAGERLRVDFTRGQMLPRLGANWEASVATGRRSGGAGGVADLTDAALAARLRVERALAAVGPELSGVLVDMCCFLKGVETVEVERGWPARSAKLMLKTALSALARHYRPPAPAARPRVLHWGTEDYRPRIG